MVEKINHVSGEEPAAEMVATLPDYLKGRCQENEKGEKQMFAYLCNVEFESGEEDLVHCSESGRVCAAHRNAILNKSQDGAAEAILRLLERD